MGKHCSNTLSSQSRASSTSSTVSVWFKHISWRAGLYLYLTFQNAKFLLATAEKFYFNQVIILRYFTQYIGFLIAVKKCIDIFMVIFFKKIKIILYLDIYCRGFCLVIQFSKQSLRFDSFYDVSTLRYKIASNIYF